MNDRTRTSLQGFHATRTAQSADELARAFVAAINVSEPAALDEVLARNFQSYAVDGVRNRTALKAYLAGLRRSFSDLRFEVHENVGVIVDDDLIALRTLMTGTHTGDYDGTAATGKPFQTSVSYIFRFRDDKLVENWQVMDTYRILVTIGGIPGVATQFQKILGVPVSADGIFVEKPGTAFGAPRRGRPATRDESRAIHRRLYDGAITTGKAEDVDALAVDYIQNTGWTPDGRSNFGHGWAVSRGAMPGGEASQIFVVAENDRAASINIWDGTVAQSGKPVDFETADFLRIEEGVAAEHWDTVVSTGP